MLNSGSKFATVFLLFVRLTVQELSFWLSLNLLKLINILVHIPVFSFLINVTGQTTICLVSKIFLSLLIFFFIYIISAAALQKRLRSKRFHFKDFCVTVRDCFFKFKRILLFRYILPCVQFMLTSECLTVWVNLDFLLFCSSFGPIHFR